MGIESKFANKIIARIASKLGVSESAPSTVWILANGLWNDLGEWKDTAFWNDGPKQWILATGVWNDSGFWDDFSNWID